MSPGALAVANVLRRVRDQVFAEIQDGFTIDPATGQQGIADLADDSWRVRLLAIRDLARLGGESVPLLTAHLRDANPHVRQVAAMAVGILRARTAGDALEERLVKDPDPIVRAQAAVSLGQVGLERSVAVLRTQLTREPDRDVGHRIQLAIGQIDRGLQPGPDPANRYAALDEATFRTVSVGRPAIDFELDDTDGQPWRLFDLLGAGPVVLIWVFADWCPVCHHEFHDLIDLGAEFEAAGVYVVTLECHDRYRCRVMTGQEASPSYGFTATPPQDHYHDRIWWPHLVDLGGAVGAMYGVDPLEFVVHSEWINRPSTFIIDAEGILRFAYVGTFWGDRPSIRETLDMIVSADYQYEHPKRLVAGRR